MFDCLIIRLLKNVSCGTLLYCVSTYMHGSLSLGNDAGSPTMTHFARIFSNEHTKWGREGVGDRRALGLRIDIRVTNSIKTHNGMDTNVSDYSI